MTGVGGQARVADLRDRGVDGEAARELGRVRLGALDAQGEGAKAAQGEPDLERPRDRPVHRAVGVQAGVQVVVVGERGAEDHVAVAGQVLGDGVDDEVGAVLERALHEGRREGVVHAHQRADRVGGFDEGRQVGHLEHRVGGRLDPEHGRPGERGHDRVGVVDVDERDVEAVPRGEVVGEAERHLVGVPGQDQPSSVRDQ